MTSSGPPSDGVSFSPGDALTLSCRCAAGTVILTVRGEVDARTADQLADAVTTSFTETPKVLVIDLTSVTRFSSEGLAVLVDAFFCSSAGIEVRVVAGAAASRPIVVAGLHYLVPVFSSLERALDDSEAFEPARW